MMGEQIKEPQFKKEAVLKLNVCFISCDKFGSSIRFEAVYHVIRHIQCAARTKVNLFIIKNIAVIFCYFLQTDAFFVSEMYFTFAPMETQVYDIEFFVRFP